MVLQEVGALAKGLPTLGAFVGLHFSVDVLMLNQEALLVEKFPALLTPVGLFPFVNREVIPWSPGDSFRGSVCLRTLAPGQSWGADHRLALNCHIQNSVSQGA